ncbi:CAMK/CDPK protein kinase [Saprolegnia diclina VS20]|uniref:CAMK/CDPK protein kinase n=1 Tax=Saprolegnia diclina (strain VS20) TaxID=1156394 RepID=T0QCT1_SAPDV|nr:CAMK/CDPK protein kinase [Saprolegnia diclina VS20]EQC32486.1 CAMK/CDPK protein kinase [Saprolegnia diclina VS20]|eukprot:XP_008613987.1 CAMK/CDPK protein kinase [Saprolegnia diclina VS20]
MGCLQSSDAPELRLPDTFLRNLCTHYDGVDVFTRYSVIKELGTGAFGVVNQVEAIGTNEQFAMKVITIGPNAKLPVLRKEIDLWRGLQHPNIVRLIETYESPTHIYMIMELCTGGHLFNAIKSRKEAFAEATAKLYVRKLAASIYYLHLKNICHRDIKLENILYETDGVGAEVKLCDFGASTMFREGVLMQTVLGSVVYMAPEFLEGQYTQACDMWSLGVVMYMLLSNAMPFHGDTEDEIIESIFEAKVVFDGESWANVSEDAKRLIQRLLEPDINKRYTALQVLMHPWVQSADVPLSPTCQIDDVITRLSEYASFGAMKRAGLLAVAFCCPSIDLSDIRRAFDELNVLHNGVLTIKDLQQASLTSKYPGVDFAKIFSSLDMENSNQVTFLEFISAVMNPTTIDETVLRKAYQLFNPDDTKGGIRIDGLARLLGPDFGELAVQDMISVADSDHDGAINYEEFVHLIQSRPVPRTMSSRRGFGL